MTRRRYMHSLMLIKLAVASASACASGSAAVSLSCPPSIAVNEQVTETVDGWTPVIDPGRRGYFLDSVAVYEGHPDQMAALAPDKTVQSKRERVHTWILNPAGAPAWMACTYLNTRMMMARPVPDQATRCQLTEALLPSGKVLRIQSFTCK